MNAGHGLSERTVAEIQEVLARFPQVDKAVLFGSRAKGTQKNGSDIDLALSGKDLDWRILGRIEDALDDLLLPYGFSLLCHDERMDSEVAAHIARVGRPFYRREASEDASRPPFAGRERQAGGAGAVGLRSQK
jgi:predicted nucleotidyltransferase